MSHHSGVTIVHAKNTGFITVQRQRLAMLINIMACGFEVRKRGLRFDEQKLHDFTGCIINVDQCGTGWSSAFKPVMIAAIDLYQFARTRTPVTWLRDPCGDLSYRRTLLLSLYNVSAHNLYYVKWRAETRKPLVIYVKTEKTFSPMPFIVYVVHF